MANKGSRMFSNRPYLVRAFYEWIVDNDCTPYVVVDAHYSDVEVPQSFVTNGQIILKCLLVKHGPSQHSLLWLEPTRA